MPKPGLPLERHRELGRELVDSHLRFKEIGNELAAAYPGDRELSSRVNQLVRQLRLVRDSLEDNMWEDHLTKADRAIYPELEEDW